MRVKDHQGRELIDCGAGLWCVNIGYGRKEMAEAAKKAIENLAYYHIFGGASNEPIIRLAERVLGLFHDKAGATHLSKVFFGSGGSDANDTNFKLVRYYNNLRGKAREEEDHLPARRLSRPHLCGRQPHGHPRLSQGLRLAGAGRAAHLLPALLPLSRRTGRAKPPSPSAWSPRSRP